MNFDEISKKVSTMAIEYAPKVLLAIITLIIGFWIIGKVVKIISKAMTNRGMDESLTRFLSSLLSVLFKVLLLFSVANMFGINTTSFLAIFGALMVGVWGWL